MTFYVVHIKQRGLQINALKEVVITFRRSKSKVLVKSIAGDKQERQRPFQTDELRDFLTYFSIYWLLKGVQYLLSVSN